jgi:outer membrane protein TolC
MLDSTPTDGAGSDAGLRSTPKIGCLNNEELWDMNHCATDPDGAWLGQHRAAASLLALGMLASSVALAADATSPPLVEVVESTVVSSPVASIVSSALPSQPSAALSAALSAAPAAAPAAAPSDPSAPMMRLTLREFVVKALASNQTLRSRRNERALADASVLRASAAFQPTLAVSAINSRNVMRNTPEEELLRQGLGIYERSGQDYSATVSALLATGAKVEVKGTMARFLTNITENLRGSDAKDYRAFYGFSVTQPLARDAGMDITSTRLRVAEMDVIAAAESTRGTEAGTIAEATFSYLDLGLAHARMDTAREKIAMTERLLSTAKSLRDGGRMADPDVAEVENNLARFQAGLSESRQAIVERVNKMRSMLSSPDKALPHTLVSADPLPTLSRELPDVDQVIRVALERHPEYRMRKLMAEREGLQLAYARNQTLPRIDLVASYGLNGLALSANGALSPSRIRDFPSWTVGLQVSVPFGKNRQAAADVMAAQARKEEALINLEGLESTLINDIHTSAAVIRESVARHDLFDQIARRESINLNMQWQRLNAGRIDIRELIYIEERLINSRMAKFEQAVANAKAIVLLAMAQGTLLEQYK